MGGTVGFSALSGGIGAELSGGDFWQGAGTGATIGLLNHLAHQIEGNLSRPKRVNLKKNPVGGLKKWMRYINRHNGVDPESGRAFNLSDMVDAQTVPKKNLFVEMFGMMNDISGVSRLNGKPVQWYIQDASISSRSINNVDFTSFHIDPIEGTWRIGAYGKPNNGVFNLKFYDYETYSNFSNYIFGK